MSQCAVVLAVRGGEAVLLERGGSFRRVKNRHYTVGQIIGAPVPASRAVRRGGLLRRMLLIACVMVLLCSSALAAGKYMTWTQVTLESGGLAVLYRLNYLDEVIEAIPLSQQAQTILAENGSDAAESIESAVEKALSGVDESGSEIRVSVSSVLRGKSARAVHAVEEAGARKGRSVHVEEHTWGERPARPAAEDPARPSAPELPPVESSDESLPETAPANPEAALNTPSQEQPDAAHDQAPQEQPDAAHDQAPQEMPNTVPNQSSPDQPAPSSADQSHEMPDQLQGNMPQEAPARDQTPQDPPDSAGSLSLQGAPSQPAQDQPGAMQFPNSASPGAGPPAIP